MLTFYSRALTHALLPLRAAKPSILLPGPSGTTRPNLRKITVISTANTQKNTRVRFLRLQTITRHYGTQPLPSRSQLRTLRGKRNARGSNHSCHPQPVQAAQVRGPVSGCCGLAGAEEWKTLIVPGVQLLMLSFPAPVSCWSISIQIVRARKPLRFFVFITEDTRDVTHPIRTSKST